jgi:copper chaperone
MSLAIVNSNLKCAGCANPIKRNIREISGVTDVVVDIEAAQVIVSGSGHLEHSVVAALTRLGYPPRNSVQGAAAVKAKAKSFVSCAIGRMSD